MDNFEMTIRPKTLDEYIGQSEMKNNLAIFMQAAKMRNQVLDHVLLYGPPGLGKTTMAYIIANEMDSQIRTISGPTIEKIGDIASVLSSIEEGDIVFIDEIHRIPKFVEEVLYSAMEDFFIDIMIGGEGNSRSVRIEIPNFTLVGATTRFGDLTGPLRDRFGIVAKLDYYSDIELMQIVTRTSKVLDVMITKEAIKILASRSRGTPRVSNRLFKRVSDFALVLGTGSIEKDICNLALEKMQVDRMGLDNTDYNLLKSIIEKFNGGPVGIEAIAASIGEEVTTIEDVHEPFLLQHGLLKRTVRGRCATNKAYEHLGIKKE